METLVEVTEHPAAALMPAMSDDEYAALRADVDAHGLLVPIVLHEGKVLDGRHRLRACRELGIEPRYETFAGDDPLAYVVATNLHRRHLTAAQRAALAVEILPTLEEAARKRQAALAGTRPNGTPDLGAKLHEGSGRAGGDTRTLGAKLRTPSSRSDEAVASLTGASGRYVSEAKRINAAAPDVLDAVKGGRLDMATAKAAAKLPEAERAKLLTGLDTTTATARKEARREIEHAARTVNRPTAAHAEAPPQRCDIRLRCWGLPEAKSSGDDVVGDSGEHLAVAEGICPEPEQRFSDVHPHLS